MSCFLATILKSSTTLNFFSLYQLTSSSRILHYKNFRTFMFTSHSTSIKFMSFAFRNIRIASSSQCLHSHSRPLSLSYQKQILHKSSVTISRLSKDRTSSFSLLTKHLSAHTFHSLMHSLAHI